MPLVCVGASPPTVMTRPSPSSTTSATVTRTAGARSPGRRADVASIATITTMAATAITMRSTCRAGKRSMSCSSHSGQLRQRVNEPVPSVVVPATMLPRRCIAKSRTRVTRASTRGVGASPAGWVRRKAASVTAIRAIATSAKARSSSPRASGRVNRMIIIPNTADPMPQASATHG